MTRVEELYTTAEGYRRAGRFRDAEAVLREIARAAPADGESWYRLGVIACQTNRPADAERFFREAARLGCGHPRLFNNLGALLVAAGRPAEAVPWFGRAVELSPGYAEAAINLGNALGGLGKPGDAIDWFRRALASDRLAPRHRDAALAGLGAALRAAGDHAGAADCSRRLLASDPGRPGVHADLGAALLGLGDAAAAEQCFRRAVALRPDYAEAHNNLGTALAAQGRHADAVAAFRQSLELDPSSPRAILNLAHALAATGRHEDAFHEYRRALGVRPDDPQVHFHVGNGLRDQGQLPAALDHFRRAVAARPDFGEAWSNLLYALWYTPGLDPAAVAAEHRRWDRDFARPRAVPAADHPNDPAPDRRLRVGYLSADLRDHVVGHNVLPLFREHDHSRVEVVCYATGRADELTARFRGLADAWRDVRGRADDEVADQIRRDGIDVLVDLGLHTAENRLLVFARRPAPVQVTFAGYPGTTGLSAIDYRLTDPHLDPGPDDGRYAEESVRLPHSFWCYAPRGDEPPVGPLPAAARGGVTFGALNNPCKANDAVVRLWAQVLRAVPDSELVMLCTYEAQRRRARDIIGAAGIDPDRVRFTGRVPRPEYLGLYNQIDVALDTVPFNGHTTSLDALWMGVPVVTRVGPTVVGRAGSSQLSNLGLGELVARSDEEFVSVAAGLAGDLPRLAGLRAGLRDRVARSPLADAAGFARGIEAAYRWMWRRWCEGRAGA
jgi:protein O-GlcNAc transferase